MRLINFPTECRETTKNLSDTLKYLSVSLILILVSGCNYSIDQKKQSTVSVSGTGTVFAKPDMVQMSIWLSKTATTTKLAQEEASKMVRQALDVLSEFGVEDKDIVTASLSFNPEYEYRSGKSILIGQKVRQAITFSVNDIQSDNQRVSRIIDKLVQINGIELNQINFNVKNNSEHFIASRRLAFQKAADKAKQYAELSGCKVGKVLSISEEKSQPFSISTRAITQNQMLEETAEDAAVGILPTGELEITTRVIVEFILN